MKQLDFSALQVRFSDLVDPVVEEHRKSFDPENIRDIIDEFLYEQNLRRGKEEEAFSVSLFDETCLSP